MTVKDFISVFGAVNIQSRSNPETVALSKLTQTKYRDEQRLYMAEGVKLSAEALRYADVDMIAVSESAVSSDAVLDIAKNASAKKVRILLFSDSAFEKISTEKAPQGVVAVVRYGKFPSSEEFSQWQNNKRLIMLDEIRDPGNLGTILRTAEALGVGGAVLSSCADIYNNKTVRASMGTVFRLPVYITDDGAVCVDIMKECGRRVIAASLGEHTLVLGKCEIQETDCPVIGNEGHGISTSVLERCTDCMRIPMAGLTESLNAASAASCIIWEYSRTFLR